MHWRVKQSKPIDPFLQALAEHDQYLRQLEAEGRGEEVYGKGVQLVVPEPAFAVKTKDANTGVKVVINICSSDKVGRSGAHGHAADEG